MRYEYFFLFPYIPWCLLHYFTWSLFELFTGESQKQADLDWRVLCSLCCPKSVVSGMFYLPAPSVSPESSSHSAQLASITRETSQVVTLTWERVTCFYLRVLTSRCPSVFGLKTGHSRHVFLWTHVTCCSTLESGESVHRLLSSGSTLPLSLLTSLPLYDSRKGRE